MVLSWRERICLRYSCASSPGKSVISAPSTPASLQISAKVLNPSFRIGFKYEKMIKPTCERLRMSLAISKTSFSDVPWRSARSVARWITGPSATGSLKGTPNSITLTAASMQANATSREVARSGSPQVIYAIREGLLAKESILLAVNLTADFHAKFRCLCLHARKHSPQRRQTSSSSARAWLLLRRRALIRARGLCPQYERASLWLRGPLHLKPSLTGPAFDP